MNTQTHLLLASAALTKRGELARNYAIVIGAFLPDLPVFALFAIAKAAGYSDFQIFDDLYFREEMRNVMGIFNSFFVAALIGFSGWLLRSKWFGWPMIWFAAALTIHAATDLPVHVDDGHRHFWPLSNFVFASPVSYWNPAYHGHVASLVEAALGIICALVIWRRFPVNWIRVLCGLAMAAYVAIPVFWIWTFS